MKYQHFMLLAGLFLVGLFVLELPILVEPIDYFCLGLAKVSAWIVGLFDSQLTVTGNILRHGETGFALQVTSDCSALTILWLYVAAVIAYPFTGRQKGLYIVVGILLIQFMNVLRLVTLYFFGDWFSPALFDEVHQYVWPFVLHLFVLFLFAWLIYHHHQPASQPATA